MRPVKPGSNTPGATLFSILGDLLEGVEGGEALLDRIWRASGLAVRIPDAHRVGRTILSV